MLKYGICPFFFYKRQNRKSTNAFLRSLDIKQHQMYPFKFHTEVNRWNLEWNHLIKKRYSSNAFLQHFEFYRFFFLVYVNSCDSFIRARHLYICQDGFLCFFMLMRSRSLTTNQALILPHLRMLQRNNEQFLQYFMEQQYISQVYVFLIPTIKVSNVCAIFKLFLSILYLHRILKK